MNLKFLTSKNSAYMLYLVHANATAEYTGYVWYVKSRIHWNS